MLYEHANGPASNWAPYFDILPTENEFNTLMFWSEDEIAELQGSAVVNKIGKESAHETFTEQLLPVIHEFASVFFSGDPRARQRAEEMRDEKNIALMHRMGTLIMSYAFDIEPTSPNSKEVDDEGFAEEEEDEALPKGMVPLADMLNADADRCNARLFYEKDVLEMKALKSIAAGEEIFNDYGPLPRSDLLRRYGYVTDNYAQFDVVEIPMDLVTDVLAANNIICGEDRLQYLDEQEVLDTGYDVTTSEPFTLQESMAPELIIVLETMLLSNEDFATLQRKGKLPKPEKMTSQCVALLLKIVEARIAQYATTLEEDLQTSSSSNEDVVVAVDEKKKKHRYAMAKAVRVGEKKILKNARDALAEKIAREGGGPAKRSRDIDAEGDVEMGGTGKKKRA